MEASASTIHTQPAAKTAVEASSDHDLRIAYYCEENAWRVVYRRIRDQPEDRFYVVFISNSIANVPMFQQRAASDPNTACCWDYHVIVLCARESSRDVVVYDIDTVLPYPLQLQEYLQQSFPYDWPFPYAPLFRLIPAKLYIEHFASDRMHMYNRQTQEWNAPPPTYRCINVREGVPSNFKRYLDFGKKQNAADSKDTIFGKILSLKELAEYPHFFAGEMSA